MVDLILRNGWNYVSAVNTDGNYGASGMKAFLWMSERAGICTAAELTVPQHADISSDPVFNQTILELFEHPRARVVVCFCEGRTVRGLLTAIKENNLTGYFHIIGSDGWADRTDVIQGLEDTALGATSIKIHTPMVPNFEEKYFSLRPVNNNRNPWLEEFWSWRFNCSLLKDPVGSKCTGSENLKEGYKQDTKLAFIVKAIYTLAHGLHMMQSEICGNVSSGYCPQMKPFDGKLYKEFLKKVKFKYQDEVVQFDRNGDPPGRYDIMNLQKSGRKTDYVTIGSWNNGTLLLTRPEEYHPRTRIYFDEFESICSKPCGVGEFKHLQEGKECCWTCVRCREEEYLHNETTCRPCLRGWWPSANITGCERIPVESLGLDQPESILVISISALGLVLTGLSTCVFVWYNDTPVVKSSSRELSYTILFGCSLAYITTFPLILTPSNLSCTLSRILPGTSIAFIYAALTTKTNRIARILAVKKMLTYRPRLMSSAAQLMLASCLIVVEATAVLVSIVLVPPVPILYYPSLTRVRLVCHNNWRGMIIPFWFDFVLLIVCTYYAIKTRNVPENFNEAKFIGFSCYTTCVIWLSYIPIWFGSDIQVIATCVCLSLSAYVTLALQFLPKLYIILLQPHKNNRSFFTTSRDVRCHIGKGVFTPLSDRKSSKVSGSNSVLHFDSSSSIQKYRQNGAVRSSGDRSSVLSCGVGPSSSLLIPQEISTKEVRSLNMSAGSRQRNSLSGGGSKPVTPSGTEDIYHPGGTSSAPEDIYPKIATVSQTEELNLYCFNCDAQVKVYPELDPMYCTHYRRRADPLKYHKKLSIVEENVFSGNNDIKKIVICINTPDSWC